MKICVVKKLILDLKKRYGTSITNFYPDVLDDDQEVVVIQNERALVFTVQEQFRQRAFFVSTDNDALCELLRRLNEGTIVESIYKERENSLKSLFNKANMEEYAVYIRKTICYHHNPYTIPEKGRREILMEMYDPDCGEYAEETDAEELYEITMETFDTMCDDVFTLERWKEIIKNRECMLYREAGRIITYYVWRIEGRKLYSNMSVNKGPANYLYNIERRVFEKMWEDGIRIYYAWYNSKNFKALRRGNKDSYKVIQSVGIIYNGVYIKK